DRLRYRIIDRKDHDGIATRPVPAHLHAGDIDVFLAQQRPDRADDARTVRVPAHQEGAVRHQVDSKIVEGDDVRLVEQQCPADSRFTVFAAGLQADQVRELAGTRVTLLDDGDALGRSDRPRVDRVDALRAE